MSRRSSTDRRIQVTFLSPLQENASPSRNMASTTVRLFDYLLPIDIQRMVKQQSG